MKDPKVFKVGIGMTLVYPKNDMVLRLKDQSHRVTKYILTLISRVCTVVHCAVLEAIS